jgi:hypothetical protein
MLQTDAPTASPPSVRDDRETPLCGQAETAGNVNLICPTVQADFSAAVRRDEQAASGERLPVGQTAMSGLGQDGAPRRTDRRVFLGVIMLQHRRRPVGAALHRGGELISTHTSCSNHLQF